MQSAASEVVGWKRRSGERREFIQRLLLDCPFPQNQQLRLMLRSPLHNKSQCARREVTSDDNKRANIYQGFVFTVLCMKMR